MKKIALRLIHFYQKYISPDQGVFKFVFGGRTCRFVPTCSCYAQEAIEKYGIIKGLFLSLKRLVRCNPFASGGFDPVH